VLTFQPCRMPRKNVRGAMSRSVLQNAGSVPRGAPAPTRLRRGGDAPSGERLSTREEFARGAGTTNAKQLSRSTIASKTRRSRSEHRTPTPGNASARNSTNATFSACVVTSKSTTTRCIALVSSDWGVAQSAERLVLAQQAAGSIPASPTMPASSNRQDNGL
jgi:hypothetical protein